MWTKHVLWKAGTGSNIKNSPLGCMSKKEEHSKGSKP